MTFIKITVIIYQVMNKNVYSKLKLFIILITGLILGSSMNLMARGVSSNPQASSIVTTPDTDNSYLIQLRKKTRRKMLD